MENWNGNIGEIEKPYNNGGGMLITFYEQECGETFYQGIIELQIFGGR